MRRPTLPAALLGTTTDQALATHYACGHAAVGRRRTAAHIPPFRLHARTTARYLDALRAHNETGLTAHALAHMLGITRQGAYDTLWRLEKRRWVVRSYAGGPWNRIVWRVTASAPPLTEQTL